MTQTKISTKFHAKAKISQRLQTKISTKFQAQKLKFKHKKFKSTKKSLFALKKAKRLNHATKNLVFINTFHKPSASLSEQIAIFADGGCFVVIIVVIIKRVKDIFHTST